MNYLGMLVNNKARGSGYAEILMEAQLVTTGCLKHVLSGKAFAKALFCLKSFVEALERLLFEVFLEENEQNMEPKAILNLIDDPSRENLELALSDATTTTIIEAYTNYGQDVRNGHLGKTAQFWMSFMDGAKLVFMMIYAVKIHDRKLFHKCNGDMANLFFAFNGQNYSRYLSWFEMFMTNIELTHPGAIDLIDKGVLGVARSMIPGALSAVDKTMEETYMKFAKGSGGLSGIFNEYGTHQRWCRTMTERAKSYEKLLDMCGLITDPECPKKGKHRELAPHQIRKSEKAVQNVMTAISNFTNPWRIPEHNRLFSLASGAPVSVEIEQNMLSADSRGKSLKKEFVEKRLKSDSEEDFFDRIPRQKYLTMADGNKKEKMMTSKRKQIQYQDERDVAMKLLVKSQMEGKIISLEEFVKYSGSPVPPQCGTPDGFFLKTNKAAMLHYIMKEHGETAEFPVGAFHIEDGNALFYMLTALGPTLGAICLQLLDRMVPKKNFIFSTDCYHPDSIKTQERIRRGSGEQYAFKGQATVRPKDFKHFLGNEVNKANFCKLLGNVWSDSKAASRLKKCNISIVTIDGIASELKVSGADVECTEILELRSNQEETDTRVVLYVRYAESRGFDSVIVRTPDTDIFFILLHHCHEFQITIYVDIGKGKQRRVINITELGQTMGREWCTVLLGFYVFSGEDCTSAFPGKGKVSPLQKLEKNPKFHLAFR